MSSLLTLVSVSGMLDLALKSAAVMLLAMVVAALLRRASAAWRHLVWCLSVASLLLLPALSLALPAWRVAWLPQWTAEPARLAATGQADLAQANRTEPLEDQPRAAIILPPSADTSATEPHNLPPATIETASPPRSPIPWLAIAWAAGGLLSLVPLAVGLWQLAALHRRSVVIGDRRWLTLLDELRRQLAVRRSVELRQCEAALAPLTWGALRPVLLVPAEASAWPDERRRLVLLHELAHVRRWDWLTQLVAHVACALYWFNPLVWLAARQMRIERERACDDLVLACGARASDYAQELLALAAGLSNVQLSTLVAVPMARRGVLEDRLRGILDSGRSRAAVTMSAVCLGAAIAAVAMAPLAMLRAAPHESPKLATDEPKPQPLVKEKPAEPSATRIVTVRGKVVDDTTGKPIGRLVFQGGRFDPSDPKKITWGYFERSSSASDGSFLTTIRWGEGWTERAVADGYVPQPVLAAAPLDGKDDIEVTIRLKRGPRVRGVVLDHAGKPVKGAAVFELGPTALNVAAGQASSSGPGPVGGKNESVPYAVTDEQGRFELATGDSKALAISHAQFDAWPAAIPASGDVTIRLPKPARVEINLDIDGADKESVIFYQLLSNHMPEFMGLQSSRYVPIANPGKLVLDALPPGKYHLCRRPGRILERQLFELKAGEVKTFDFVRKQGARVRGKVTWPAGAELSSIVVSVVGETTHKSPFEQFEWNPVYASLAPGEDGAFLTERIAPGTYQLQAYAFKSLTEKQLYRTGATAPSYHAQMKIEVPSEGELKVADLALKPIRAEEPDKESVKEQPAAEQPAEKPAEAAAAPQKNPLLGKEAAEHVKKFRPSFSKAQEGIEIGIMIASDRKAFHEGERVPLELVIRNVSQKTLFVQHGLYPPHTPPTVTGPNGKQILIDTIRLLGATRLYQDILKPNEVAVYRHMGLGLGEKPQPPGTFWHPFLKNAAAGKYRLSQPAYVTVREQGQDAGGTALNTATGEVEFEIESADSAKANAAAAEKGPGKPDMVRGVVLDHAGRPLKAAAVYALGSTQLSVSAGQAWRTDGEHDNEARPVRTDEQGRFELPIGGAKTLAVSHPQFDAWPAAIPESGDMMIRLPEPARVEINLDIDGADKESYIYYELIVSQVPEFKGLLLLRSERSVKIDNPGKLVLAGLPPGKYQLSRRRGLMLENQMFEIKSGEVKTINYIRQTGARVRGKITWPADAKPTSIGISVVGDTVYAATSPAGDGAFLTERIPPGTHQLVAYAYKELTPEQMKMTGVIAPSFHAQVKIEVPADGELKVGDLALKPIRAGE